MRGSRGLLLAASLALLPGAASAAPYTVITYNLGLLEVFGSDFVPAVNARTLAAPAALSALASTMNPRLILLEEVWADAAADSISRALSALGYAAVRPNVHTAIGLTSGLLLLVRAPLRVDEWKFTPFSRTTFVDSFARKGVLEAVIEDPADGTRVALVATHTVAVDTDGGQPKDRSQLDAILAQADQVRAAVSSRSSGGALPVVLLGDFNVGPGYVDDAWRRFIGLEGLHEATGTGPASRVTWDPGNPLVRYGGYPREPAAWIDHVLVMDGGGKVWTTRSVQVLMQEPIADLSFTPRGGAPVHIPLSDHYALAAELELSAE